MPNKKNDKKPIVNWFSRKKEVEFSAKKVGNKDMNVKTKVVKAPESMLSKGFEKKVVRTSTPLSEEKREKNWKKGAKRIGAGVGVAILGNIANAGVHNEISKKIGRDYEGAYKNKDKVKMDEAQKKHEKNDSRYYKNSNRLLAAIPLSLTAGIPIMSKKNKNTKVVTKTKSDRKK